MLSLQLSLLFLILATLHVLRSDKEVWMEVVELLHVMPVRPPSLYSIWHLDGSPETPPEAFLGAATPYDVDMGDLPSAPCPVPRTPPEHCVGGGEAPDILAAKGEK